MLYPPRVTGWTQPPTPCGMESLPRATTKEIAAVASYSEAMIYKLFDDKVTCFSASFVNGYPQSTSHPHRSHPRRRQKTRGQVGSDDRTDHGVLSADVRLSPTGGLGRR